MRVLSFFLLGVILLGVGCAQQAQAPAPDDDRIAQVKVTADGKIFLNGSETTLDALKAEFARLHDIGGQVIYYRENPQAEPHPIAQAVIQAVIDAQLPITLSETDFQ